jgi:hypothetical protein
MGEDPGRGRITMHTTNLASCSSAGNRVERYRSWTLRLRSASLKCDGIGTVFLQNYTRTTAMRPKRTLEGWALPSVFDKTQCCGYPCLMPRHRTTTHPEVLPMKPYLFHVKIEQEDDSRWRVWIETLQGFAARGYSPPSSHRPQLRRLPLTKTENRVRCIYGSSITLQLIGSALGDVLCVSG